MPAKSVIFDELRKYYGRYVRNLKTRDFYQMAGRAGRRGIDKEGFVYCRINPQRIKIEEVRQVIYNQPEEVRSQLNTSYATILNLYEKYKEGIYKIYPLSLHYFQSRRHEQKEALRLMEAKLKLLRDLGYIQADALSQKGIFAKTVYGYELILSELYAQNILEGLDEFSLGIVCCAAVFEPRKRQHLPILSKAAKALRLKCDVLYQEIKQRERKYRIYPFSKAPYFHLSNAIEAWLRGTHFARIRQLTDVDEGEIVRYFRMGIQVLREIKDAKVASPLLKERLKETIRVINRDVVDAERQLREG
jgi:superfamily II RNA helicase